MPTKPSSGQKVAVNVSSVDSTLEEEPFSRKLEQAVVLTPSRQVEVYSEQTFGTTKGSAGPCKINSYLRGFESSRKPRTYSSTLTSTVQRQDAEYSPEPKYHDPRRTRIPPDVSGSEKLARATEKNKVRQLGSFRFVSVLSQHDENRESESQVDEGHGVNNWDANLKSPVISRIEGSLEQNAVTLSPFSGIHTYAVGKTPRIQYLINYYSEVISPVIVAFDGPTNPYRSCILRLASGSETLQHAISALSASNLRQRRESGELSTGKTDPARRSSRAHVTLTDEAWQSAPGYLSVEDQRNEENYHKNATVQLIQRQLADPSQHRDDSVLATLLIICLFHICESGVAKFKTHFAGAKKLLGMRENGGISKSKEAKWFTRMFTWFDAMTATVNDREGQMQDGLLDLSSLADEDWTLENLAGCDGKLFKIIAKLSRLNILSQKGTLDSAHIKASCNTPIIAPILPYCNIFDENNWVTRSTSITFTPPDESSPKTNTQYGREWHETRNALISWSLDTSAFGSGLPNVPALSQEQQLDLLNISESFRCSALVYTERLAFPSVPSFHPRIQNWVQRALLFIRLVRSDVYLLWPLFVTGSECVTEGDRHVIRQRCLDIQKDSGFSNNASCLKLLEKIWKANSRSDGSGDVDRENGFRWRSVMQTNVSGGEYIVV